MADLPFGFNPGDDPDRDKPKKDPDSPSGSDPFGFGGAGFDMSDLGSIFSKLGEMFSGAGNVMGSGKQSGPVNYDLARQLASSSIGFVKPISEQTTSAISDAVHLAETWLDGVTRTSRGHHPGGRPGHRPTGSTTPWTRGSGCAIRSPNRSPRCGRPRCPRRPRPWLARCWR